jgi:hypothetical protein
MKITKVIILLALCTLTILTKKHRVPTGSLLNHYGGPVNPVLPGGINKYEQLIESNPDFFMPNKISSAANKLRDALQFKPYPGMDKKMNPHFIKSGKLPDNTERLINPQYADPKLSIQGEINMPTLFQRPVLERFEKAFVPVNAYDKKEGRIIQDHVVMNRPVYSLQNEVIYCFILGYQCQETD